MAAGHKYSRARSIDELRYAVTLKFRLRDAVSKNVAKNVARRT